MVRLSGFELSPGAPPGSAKTVLAAIAGRHSQLGQISYVIKYRFVRLSIELRNLTK